VKEIVMSSLSSAFEWSSERTSRKPNPVLGLVGAILREIRLRRALRDVGALDDSALVDMGISRGGIEDAVRHGRT
jgi:uncharacterized protein YjiS (DUF1127 family)